MSIAKKLRTIAENMEKVYEAGVKTGSADNYDEGYEKGYTMGEIAGREKQSEAFWDSYSQNKTRYNWNYAFFGYGWNDTTYNPFSSFDNVKYCQSMFSQSSITDIKVSLDLTNLTSASSLFLSSTKLKTIPLLIVHKDLTYTNVFKGCSALENLTIQGVIGKNGFDVQDSVSLTTDSLLSVLDALEDKTGDTSGTAWVITIGDVNKAKLTEEELAIAENKGWSVA